VSFAAITLCVASPRVFIFVVVYFFIDSVRKLLDTPSHMYMVSSRKCMTKCKYSEVHVKYEPFLLLKIRTQNCKTFPTQILALFMKKTLKCFYWYSRDPII
jgi:hypothetical protein